MAGASVFSKNISIYRGERSKGAGSKGCGGLALPDG